MTAPRMEPEIFWTDETALSLALYDLAAQFGDCVRDVRNEQPQGFTWARNRGVEAAMPSSLVRI